MKSRIYFVAMLAFATLFCACEKEGGPNNNPMTVGVNNTSATSVTVGPLADEFTIQVTFDGSWDVKSAAQWLHFSRQTGDGNGEVKVVTEKSEKSEKTEATIRIVSSTGGSEAEIAVTRLGVETE